MFATFRIALKHLVSQPLVGKTGTLTLQDVTFPASSVPASLVLTTLARRRCKGPGCPPPDTKKSPAGSTREQENGGSVIRRHRLIASRDGAVAHGHASVTPQNPGVTLRVQGESASLARPNRHALATRRTKALESFSDSRATRTLSFLSSIFIPR